jgi:Domain of Unknown Function (DUF748)
MPGKDSLWRARWRRASKPVRIAIVAVVVLLIVARLCLPSAVERYVNRQLNRAHDYGGRIGHVDIQLYRGQYRIHAIQIFKRDHGGELPLFAATRLDLAIEWRELFHGSVVGQVVMVRPQLNFEETQTGTNVSWDQMLGSLFPFKLNRMDVLDGQVHFRSPHANPPVDIYLTNVTVTATNLGNSREIKSELPAGVVAHASTVGGGGVKLNLRLNPLKASPTYEITAEITNVALAGLNDFFKAYGKFDVESGQFAMFASVAAKDGNYEGYLKVFFGKLKVFKWEKEKKKDALEIFWQAVVGATTTLLKNQFNDQLATRIPISGTYGDKSVGVWSAIGTLLRNAFIRALIPRLDEPVTIQQVDQKAQKVEHFEHMTNGPPQKGDQRLLGTEPKTQP